MIAASAIPLVAALTGAAVCPASGGAVAPHEPAGAPPLLPATAHVQDVEDVQSLEELWDSGRDFEPFLSQVSSRRNTWRGNYERGEVPEELLARARAAGGPWRLLVVAEDWCGDSAHTIPYLARLAEAVETLAMRIVDSTLGRTVMEAHRTPDGRAATPTLILLDASFAEVGCWVERPSELQEWFLENEGVLEEDDLYDRKYAWYDEDQGRRALLEIVELMEGAAAGSPVCGASEP